MASRRALKMAEAIREVVGMAILAELRDPRIRNVTVTYVEVSDDLRHAKVHVSVMGTETEQELSRRGLQNAAGYLQSKIAKRVELRFTPRLNFVLDQGVKRSIEVAQILKRVLPPEPATDEPDEDASLDAEENESPDESSARDLGSGGGDEAGPPPTAPNSAQS